MSVCYDGTVEWRSHGSDEFYVSQVAEEIEYTWHQAREWCMNNGGDLVSIHSAEEHAFITNWASISSNLQIFKDTDLWYNSPKYTPTAKIYPRYVLTKAVTM